MIINNAKLGCIAIGTRTIFYASLTAIIVRKWAKFGKKRQRMKKSFVHPALLDSVRWKEERVASVLQRTYQESVAPTN
ncbi:MAG: hypothetical protein KAI83_14065 [Thiomargarita sp.]|nr:hypothetical protein [Thiomargarita sp.]